MSEIELSIGTLDPLQLYGPKNANLKLLKESYPKVNITCRGPNIKLSGKKSDTQDVKAKIEMMMKLLKENDELTSDTVKDLLSGLNPYNHLNSDHASSNVIVHGAGGRQIKARTKNQKKLLELSEVNDIVFAIGPAGTGKTYTAVAIAVKALKNKLVKKIILTRPAVEAGESLGFLPGDLKEKVDPYLRPLYDALDDMLPSDKLAYMMTNRIIEVAPLAFMRGRTLNNAYIILDEAQNCTSMQLKMFLTRLGPSAKCIVTGDLSQVDLPRRQKSGLIHALDLLRPIGGIAEVRLDSSDVVRHRLVKEIIKAYDKEDQSENDLPSSPHNKMD